MFVQILMNHFKTMIIIPLIQLVFFLLLNLKSLKLSLSLHQLLVSCLLTRKFAEGYQEDPVHSPEQLSVALGKPTCKLSCQKVVKPESKLSIIMSIFLKITTKKPVGT